MKITIGALAHVDAGKTSLADSILFLTNTINHKGRVDHQDSFFDYNPLEKTKGITIYNKEATFKYKDNEYIYLDTPGHSDLAYEANRSIKILDCAILIISAIEDIPSDTIKQFNNLKSYNIPIIIFVNKMDIAYEDKKTLISKIKNRLDENCIDNIDTYEYLSLLNEELLNQYLSNNTIDDAVVTNHLLSQDFFPVFFGSALKDEGIIDMLEYINQYVKTEYDKSKQLDAYIYKISNDYSFIKVLSGTLSNKTSFNEYKINEMYKVNGNTFEPIQSCLAGNVCAVKGIKQIKLGTYLPSMNMDDEFLMPSLTYAINSNLEANELYKTINVLNNEEPNLKITLNNSRVYINLNGELHQTIITNTIKERFNIDIQFSTPIIKYKETINEVSYGVGHFEPLRHYGEAIVKIEPIKEGVLVESKINNNFTNTLLSYLRNYNQKGILTNSYLTNIKITILDIKTHPKHTEGQDLIESVRRAIRQALSKVDSVLLEPFYLTTINATTETMNTILSEITQLKYTYTIENDNILVSIPISTFNSTITNLRSKLKGNLNFSIEQTLYDKCRNPEEVISNRNYDYRKDMHNPAGSIFCKQGAGHYVEPEEVEQMMHLDMSSYLPSEKTHAVYNKSSISEEELKRVWNMVYKPKPRYIEKDKSKQEEKEYVYKKTKPLLYLIDGYNLMYEIDEELAIADLMNARNKTVNLVCDFAGYVSCQVVLVFDAYNVSNIKPTVNTYDNITIVYTKQNQTADSYIEKSSKELQDTYKVIVVSSDNLEQVRILSNNSSRLSSREFLIRYDNFKKNNTKVNNIKPYKPLEELKFLLEFEE